MWKRVGDYGITDLMFGHKYERAYETTSERIHMEQYEFEARTIRDK